MTVNSSALFFSFSQGLMQRDFDALCLEGSGQAAERDQQQQN